MKSFIVIKLDVLIGTILFVIRRMDKYIWWLNWNPRYPLIHYIPPPLFIYQLTSDLQKRIPSLYCISTLRIVQSFLWQIDHIQSLPLNFFLSQSFLYMSLLLPYIYSWLSNILPSHSFRLVSNQISSLSTPFRLTFFLDLFLTFSVSSWIWFEFVVFWIWERNWKRRLFCRRG